MATLPKHAPAALLLAGLFASTTASAALVVRPGGMVYDTDLNITWLQDANTFATQWTANPNLVNDIIAASGGVVHDTPNDYDKPKAFSGTATLSASDFNAGGQMTWWGAHACVNYLNSSHYKGYSECRVRT